MENRIKAYPHLIATDGGRIGKIGNRLALFDNPQHHGSDYEFQHFYLTIDKEIKEPCWVLMFPETGDKADIPQLKYVENVPENPKYFDMRGGYAIFRYICKKIVATTNEELWDITSHPKGFIQLKVPKIPTSFIEQYIKLYNEGSPIKEIRLETCVAIDCVYPDFCKCKDIPEILECEYGKQSNSGLLKLTPDGCVIICPEANKKELGEFIKNNSSLRKIFEDAGFTFK